MRRLSIIPFVAVLPFGSIAFAQNWINPAGGSWGTASNWNGDALPTTPTFDLGSAGYTVTLDKSYVVPSVTVQTDTVTLSLGGFTLESPALNIATGAGQVGSLTLLGPGEFYATNPFTGGSGAVSGGQLTVNGATVYVGGGEESGAGFNVNGLLVDNGGTVNLAVPGNYSVSNGTLNDGSVGGSLGMSLSLNNMNLRNGSSAGDQNVSLGNATLDNSSIDADDSLSVTGMVTLQDHADLSFILGSVSGTVTVLPTARLAAGGELAMASTGTVSLELAAQNSAYTIEPWTGNNGTLDITLQPGFDPVIGEQFDVLVTASPSQHNPDGTFATLNLPSLPTGEFWDTSDLYTTGVISVVPEPMSLGIIGIGLAGLTLRRRTRR